MPRVKRSVNAKKKRREVLEQASGYWGLKSKTYRRAKEQVMRSGNYAFRDRKARKRDFRKLWIIRINAGARQHGISYSQLMHGLKLAEIEVDRKILADLAVAEPKAFAVIVEKSKAAIAEKAKSATDARDLSSSNPRLKRARRLQGRRARSLLGMFIAEGEDLLDAAIAAGIAPFEVLAVPDVALPVDPLLVEPALLAEVGTLGHPARVLSFFRTGRPARSEAVGDLALELHGVRDPGNIGTLLRSLAAFGPGTVCLGEECADPTSPKAVRASMGAIFSVPVRAGSPRPACGSG